MLKIILLFKKFTNFTSKNSVILRINNAKFSGYFFTGTQTYRGNFQICISVPLKLSKVEYNFSEVCFKKQPPKVFFRKKVFFKKNRKFHRKTPVLESLNKVPGHPPVPVSVFYCYTSCPFWTTLLNFYVF